MPRTLCEEAHPGHADNRIEACRVAEDDKFEESEHNGSCKQDMMAKRSDTLLCETAKHWPFELDWDHGGEEDGMRRVGEPFHVKHVLEEHEIGWAPRHNPGPQFAVRGVIMCDVPGSI